MANLELAPFWNSYFDLEGRSRNQAQKSNATGRIASSSRVSTNRSSSSTESGPSPRD